MPVINYNNRSFVGTENYDSGDLTSEIVFKYQQKGDVVWALFEGPRIKLGTLVAQADPDGDLEMVWHYLNVNGRLVAGSCSSKLEILPDGRYRLHETWRIHDSFEEGHSVIEEVRS